MNYRVINHIPSDAECFLIKDNKAYFTRHENDLPVHFAFKFNNALECKSFRTTRDVKNLKEKSVESYMATDERGFFCYEKYNVLKKALGLHPTPPMSILDLQAQRRVFGLYLDLDHEQETELLLLNAEMAYKNRKLNKESQSSNYKSVDERLKQLCDRFKVDYVFANIFLDDIKARYMKTKQLDEEVNIAIILGLINKG